MHRVIFRQNHILTSHGYEYAYLTIDLIIDLVYLTETSTQEPGKESIPMNSCTRHVISLIPLKLMVSVPSKDNARENV